MSGVPTLIQIRMHRCAQEMGPRRVCVSLVRHVRDLADVRDPLSRKRRAAIRSGMGCSGRSREAKWPGERKPPCHADGCQWQRARLESRKNRAERGNGCSPVLEAQHVTIRIRPAEERAGPRRRYPIRSPPWPSGGWALDVQRVGRRKRTRERSMCSLCRLACDRRQATQRFHREVW